MIADLALLVMTMAILAGWTGFVAYWRGYSARTAELLNERRRLLDDLDTAGRVIGDLNRRLSSFERHLSARRHLGLVQGGAR